VCEKRIEIQDPGSNRNPIKASKIHNLEKMELKYLICVGLLVLLAGFATAMVDTPPQRLKKLINDGKCHLVSYH
jgi:hypothetical protein